MNTMSIKSNVNQKLRDTCSRFYEHQLPEIITEEILQCLPNIVDLYNLNSCEGLELLQNIKSLNVYLSNLPNLEPLSKLKNLECLSLINCNISDISTLSSLENLYELRLQENNIKDLNPIFDFKKLEWLNISNNPISDLTPLSKLKNLEYLFAKNCDIKNVFPLRNNLNLNVIHLENNNIKDITPLRFLKPSLSALYIDGNPIETTESKELYETIDEIKIKAKQIISELHQQIKNINDYIEDIKYNLKYVSRIVGEIETTTELQYVSNIIIYESEEEDYIFTLCVRDGAIRIVCTNDPNHIYSDVDHEIHEMYEWQFQLIIEKLPQLIEEYFFFIKKESVLK